MELQICRIHCDARIPEYKTSGAACFDLEVIQETEIPAGEIAYLPTGLVFVIPENHFLAVLPRSSASKTGLIVANSPGVIDSDYRGPNDEVKIIVRNVTDITIKVEKYQRIAQAMILPVPKIQFKEISITKLQSESRGGMGSTGSI